MINMGKPLILAIGMAAGLVSVALAYCPRYERVPNVDGREYTISRWTGRVAVCDTDIDAEKPH